MFTLPLRHPGHPLDPAELRMRAHELIQMGGGPGDRIIVDLHPDDCPCEACELFRILETAVQRGWLVNPALRLATDHSRRITPLPTGEIHDHSSTVEIVVCNDSARLLERLGIPLIATITPQPDPIYGHTFKWPPAVARFLKTPTYHSNSNSHSHQEVHHV